jgi:hypothetical protein
MKTDRHETPRNATLSPTQAIAVAALLAGKTVTAAAADAGCDRATVHRWLREDHVFRASLNAGRRELRDAVTCRLERLAEKAAECVEKAIDDGDVKAALGVLKGLQVLAPAAIGSADPTELAADDQLHALEQAANRQQREVFARMRL